MGDAVSAGHEVHLAGPDQCMAAEGVAMFDLSAEQPAHRLQTGVRMRGQVHATRRGDIVRTVVIGEAPGADERALPLGQRPPHAHGAWTAEGDLSSRQDIDPGGPGRPLAFGELSAAQSRGIGFRVAHREHLLIVLVVTSTTMPRKQADGHSTRTQPL
ncbi:hypothetical protein RKD29_001181 [Streptomyces tendae]